MIYSDNHAMIAIIITSASSCGRDMCALNSVSHESTR